MSNLKVLLWKNREGTGDPEVEVRIPSTMAKWIPRMMAFVPRKRRDEIWGEDVDFEAMFANIEQLMSEARASGVSEIADVKTRDGHVKVMIE